MRERSAATRIFGFDDQRQFAELSGDHNPMHLDPIAARRTQAGAPVVHGLNLLLWALETWATTVVSPPPMRKLRVRFVKFVYVGETAAVQLIDRNACAARLQVVVDSTPVAVIVIEFGEPSFVPDFTEGDIPLLTLPHTPLIVEFDAIGNYAGCLPFATPCERVASVFPAVAGWINARRLTALLATTNLVGMVCPGLHSIFGSLSVEICPDSIRENILRFRVTLADRRFRLVRIAISGGGVIGSIDSFSRMPPTPQVTMTSLMGLVSPDEFAGSTALVVGGSRGIGEFTAKLIAAGGGRTIITYRSGKADAEKVATEIRERGGVCRFIKYDARLPASPQLASLFEAPTHLYYFATPPIFGRQAETFSRQRFEAFLTVYVDGFQQLVQSLHARRSDLSVFYPSSVAVAQRTQGMTEYAMAKAAGEILCTDLNDTLAPLHILVKRLPRLATDQTANIIPIDTCSTIETMLPLVRDMQASRKTSA